MKNCLKFAMFIPLILYACSNGNGGSENFEMNNNKNLNNKNLNNKKSYGNKKIVNKKLFVGKIENQYVGIDIDDSENILYFRISDDLVRQRLDELIDRSSYIYYSDRFDMGNDGFRTICECQLIYTNSFHTILEGIDNCYVENAARNKKFSI